MLVCTHMYMYLRYNKVRSNSNIPSRDFEFFYQLNHNKSKC